jgi:hypothetical protein
MWKKILLGILAFIILVVVLSFWLTSGMSDVANKQLDALRKGDINTAYSLTSKAFHDDTSLDKFQLFMDKYPAFKNNREASWGSRQVSGNTGVLVGTLTANDGTAMQVEYHFIKENNEWKILGFGLTNVGAKTAPAQAPAPAVAPTTAPAVK